jgi:hypothetical protein
MQMSFARFLLVPVLAVCAIASARAAVILTIDVTDPEKVLFTATGAHAQNNDVETSVGQGFTLLGFFNQEVDYDYTSFDRSNLKSPGASFAYGDLFVASISGDGRDLNIAGSGFVSQDFSATEAAFTGSARIDLSAWMSTLTPGTTGDILAGDAFYNTVVIGQYQIIPEPGTISLLIGAGLLLAVGLRMGRVQVKKSEG